MGQFGNQPDFATSSIQEITPSDTISAATKLNGAVIYIGDNSTVGNELKVIPSGVVAPGGGFPTAAQGVTFKGLGTGGFSTSNCGLCISNWNYSSRTYSS